MCSLEVAHVTDLVIFKETNRKESYIMVGPGEKITGKVIGFQVASKRDPSKYSPLEHHGAEYDYVNSLVPESMSS